MAEDASNRLRFSIEESVWLNKGQEVDEIVSMSLEPDISIVENKHYVSVRGSLKLSGEYRQLPEGDPESAGEPPMDEERSLQSQQLRPVDEWVESDNGTVQIEHHFPVDITIPLSRIERLEDIYVVVDSFDYTLPENDCLRLEADISISGMADEEETWEADTSAEEEIEPVATASDLRTSDEDFDTEEEPEESPFEPFHYEAVREATEEDSEYYDEPDAVRNQGPLVEMKSRANEPEPSPAYFGYAEEVQEDRVEEESYEEDWEDTEEEEEEPQRSRSEENALYLTKMMAKDDEEFSSLKMCIIQRGESLDTIAERYELPPSQLVRVNRLESEEVEEGQILYIPFSS
ncbi:MAG TPA: stage VI sporulation protein D [Bacillales bacterium]|nr:stage VI sporulation protein D [Bacillales bacterium]